MAGYECSPAACPHPSEGDLDTRRERRLCGQFGTEAIESGFHLHAAHPTRSRERTYCSIWACHARPSAAQNDVAASSRTEHRTGVSCVERPERIGADMARSAALACRRSVRAFGAQRSSADLQLCSGAHGVMTGRPRGHWPRVTGLMTQCQPVTAKRRQVPGTPLSSCSPRSAKSRPDPTTRGGTVPDTSTSPPLARAATRAPMWTAIPASS
jgi:hypothetical protein